MANTGFKGINCRQTGTALIFDGLLQDSTGALVTSGTTSLYLYEVQSDGSLKSYDFNDNTFKTTSLTTETVSLTHRTGNNGGTNTGYWSYALSTLTGFTVGAVYVYRVKNTLASPTDQLRKIVYGSAEGDLAVTANGTGVGEINSDVKMFGGTAGTFAAGIPAANTTQINGTNQTARDLGASVLLSAGTAAGQLDFTAGVVKSNLAQILGTALTETAGYLAAAFKKFFNIQTPTLTTAGSDQSGDSYARLGAPAGGSIAADVAASLSAINNINNLSALANLFSPSTMVRPASGSIVYPFTFVVKDSEGHLVDVDTNAVTLTALTAAGTDRSANLSGVIHAGTGEYTFTYTVSSAHADEGLRFTASGTVQSATRKAYSNAEVADADSLTALVAIQAKTDQLLFDGNGYVKADVEDWRGSQPDILSSGKVSVDVKLWLASAPAALSTNGYVQAMLLRWLTDNAGGTPNALASNRVDASVGAYPGNTPQTGDVFVLVGSPATGTLAGALAEIEAETDAIASLPSAAQIDTQLTGSHGAGSWQTGSAAGSGAHTVTVAVTDGSAAIENAVVRFTVGVNTFVQQTDAAGRAVFALDNATYTLGITKAGYSFTPVAVVISADISLMEAMTAIVIPSPPLPSQCTSYLTTYDAEGRIEANVVITFDLVSIATPGAFNSAPFSVSSDNSGALQVLLLRNGQYTAKRQNGRTVWFTVPDAATLALPTLLGHP